MAVPEYQLCLFLLQWFSFLEKQAEKMHLPGLGGSPVTRVCGLCACIFVFAHLLRTMHALSGCGGLMLVPTKATLSPLSTAGQGRENVRKGSWVGIRAGRNHSSVTVMGKKNT